MAPNRELLTRITLSPPPRPATRSRRYLENHAGAIIWLTLVAAANLVIFVTVMAALPDGGSRSMQLGRATGGVLTFDTGLILLPVMRRLPTRVRAS